MAASKNTKNVPLDFALSLQDSGVGEIVLNSVDRDGTFSGYDLDLIDLFANTLSVPLTVIGGASSFADFGSLFSRYGLIGAGAGSVFVFKGKYKAVLIQYPEPALRRPVWLLNVLFKLILFMCGIAGYSLPPGIASDSAWLNKARVV